LITPETFLFGTFVGNELEKYEYNLLAEFTIFLATWSTVSRSSPHFRMQMAARCG
jgi:hypothetical protein